MRTRAIRHALVYFGLADPEAEAQVQAQRVPLWRSIAALAIVTAIMSGFLVLVGERALQAVILSAVLTAAVLAVNLVFDRH